MDFGNIKVFYQGINRLDVGELEKLLNDLRITVVGSADSELILTESSNFNGFILTNKPDKPPVDYNLDNLNLKKYALRYVIDDGVYALKIITRSIPQLCIAIQEASLPSQ